MMSPNSVEGEVGALPFIIHGLIMNLYITKITIIFFPNQTVNFENHKGEFQFPKIPKHKSLTKFNTYIGLTACADVTPPPPLKQ